MADPQPIFGVQASAITGTTSPIGAALLATGASRTAEITVPTQRDRSWDATVPESVGCCRHCCSSSCFSCSTPLHSVVSSLLVKCNSRRIFTVLSVVGVSVSPPIDL
jgi:hypothetical protein